MKRSRKMGSALRKFLWAFLPVAVSLLILGLSAIYISSNFINKEIVSMTTRQLDYLKDSLELSLYELDALNLTLSSNKTVISSVDHLFAQDAMTMDDVLLARSLSDGFNAQINARTYVDSVYFYLDAYPDRFLSTMEGIVRTSDFRDVGWLGSYASIPSDAMIWTEMRPITKIPGNSSTTADYLTMYRRLYPIVNNKMGVIVMNMNKDFFDDLVSGSLVFKGQEIYLCGAGGGLILGSDGRKELSPHARDLGSRDIPRVTEEAWGGESYYVYSSQTSRYGWRLVSMIPSRALNRVPLTIRTLIIAVLLGSLLVGMAISYSLERKKARRFAAVVRLFEMADRGEALPEHPEEGNDEYDFMVRTLIGTFLKQRFAALQLSERQARTEVLELRALRAQMNPHFLFNTLETLYWMVFGTEGKPSPAADVVKHLSSILRYSLSEGERASFAEEVGVSKRYVALQRLRHRKKFSVSWMIADETRELIVPKFILQPQIENVVQHALPGDERECVVLIEARLDGAGQTLLISVKDDGVGMSAERLGRIRGMLTETDHPTDHTGLYNSSRRIILNFGPAYGLEIGSVEGTGTTITIRLPVVRIADGNLSP